MPATRLATSVAHWRIVLSGTVPLKCTVPRFVSTSILTNELGRSPFPWSCRRSRLAYLTANLDVNHAAATPIYGRLA
jgi:hypothetical protein